VCVCRARRTRAVAPGGLDIWSTRAKSGLMTLVVPSARHGSPLLVRSYRQSTRVIDSRDAWRPLHRRRPGHPLGVPVARNPHVESDDLHAIRNRASYDQDIARKAVSARSAEVLRADRQRGRLGVPRGVATCDQLARVPNVFIKIPGPRRDCRPPSGTLSSSVFGQRHPALLSEAVPGGGRPVPARCRAEAR